MRVELNEAFCELVKAVRLARAGKENCPSAKEEVDISEVIRSIIQEAYFKKDYEEITSKILYEKVTYDVTIESLKKLLRRGI